MTRCSASWAGIDGPAYAIDEETALAVADGFIEVVSEGHWKLLGGTLAR